MYFILAYWRTFLGKYALGTEGTALVASAGWNAINNHHRTSRWWIQPSRGCGGHRLCAAWAGLGPTGGSRCGGPGSATAIAVVITQGTGAGELAAAASGLAWGAIRCGGGLRPVSPRWGVWRRQLQAPQQANTHNPPKAAADFRAHLPRQSVDPQVATSEGCDAQQSMLMGHPKQRAGWHPG